VQRGGEIENPSHVAVVEMDFVDVEAEHPFNPEIEDRLQ
jgi:hypothetical protein